VFSANFAGTASLLKNPFAPSYAPGSGAEYAVFVAFWPCFQALFNRRPSRHLLFQQAAAFYEVRRFLGALARFVPCRTYIPLTHGYAAFVTWPADAA
jgi:hypothetical protein